MCINAQVYVFFGGKILEEIFILFIYNSFITSNFKWLSLLQKSYYLKTKNTQNCEDDICKNVIYSQTKKTIFFLLER